MLASGSPAIGPPVSLPPRPGTEVPIEPGVVQAAVSDDGTRCYAVRDQTRELTSDGTRIQITDISLEIWDVAAGRRSGVVDLHPNGPLVNGPLVVSRDGRFVASAFVQEPGYRTLVIDLENAELLNARGRVCAFSPDGQRILSCQADTAYVMLSDGLRERSELFVSRGWIHDLAFSTSGDLVAAACTGSGLSVFDVASRIAIAEFPGIEAIATAFGDTDEDLVALTSDGTIVTVELLSRHRLRARAQRFVHRPISDLDQRDYALD